MRLVSWNLQWCRGMDGVVDPARIARVSRELADPDVCCFQEVAQGFAALPGSAGEDQVAALLQGFPGYSAHFGWGVDLGGGQRFGNLILSRLPVGRVLRHSLPWPAADNVLSMPRVAVEVVVDAGWGQMRVLTTHLEFYSRRLRAAQVEGLLGINDEGIAHSRAAPAVRDDEGPFRPRPRPAPGILTGDFNMKPDDPLVARLGQGFVDAWTLAHPGTPHAPTFQLDGEKESPYCCDFVFVTPDLAPRVRRVRVDGATRASDHQPVVVELA